MSKIFAIVILTITFYSSNANAGAQIKFPTQVCNYGTLQKNDDGNRIFKFYNVGNEPLIIVNVNTSCGCLVGSWPHDPIAPGDSGIIKANYSTDRIGAFSKTLTLTSNSEKTPTTILKIYGIVWEHFTTIKFETEEIDVGTIRFGEEKKLSVKYVNTDNCYLHACTSSIDNDIIQVKQRNVSSSDDTTKTDKVKDRYPTSHLADTGYLDVNIRNLVGNTGRFQHKIYFAGNFKDTVWITVHGIFKGRSNTDTIRRKESAEKFGVIYDEERIFMYKKHHLKNVMHVTSNKLYTGETITNYVMFQYNFGQQTEVTISYFDDKKRLVREEKVINGILRRMSYCN